MKKNSENLDFIQRLWVGLYTESVPSDIRETLLISIAAYERGEFKTLDDALGLRGPGIKSIFYQVKLNNRNTLLKKIAVLTCTNPDAWESAKMLSLTIQQFETRTLPRLSKNKLLPEDLPQWQKLLFECFQIGIKVPSSAKRLHKIL